MSDETPDSGAYEEPSDIESTEASEVADEPAVQVVSPVVAKSGIQRRTANAPVRKKDLIAAEVDPERDDETIAALEEALPEGESSNAPAAVMTSRKPVKKAGATRRRAESKREASDPYGPTTPGNFVKQSARELKQVVWPTWPELVSHFTAVLVFVLFFIAFIGLLDVLFGWSLLKLLGGAQ